jgi:hypothetical protein
MTTKRKQKLWVRFDGDHEPQPDLAQQFSNEEWATLTEIYEDTLVAQDVGSDNLAFDDNLAACVSNEFRRRTGRSVPGRVLLAAIMDRRKRGEWVKLGAGAGGIEFSDIDQVAG